MALRSCGTHKHIIPGVSQKTVSGLCILWGITEYRTLHPPNSGPGLSPGHSEQTVQVTSGVGGNKQMCAVPTSISPTTVDIKFVESLFFLVLFSFDLDLCVTASSRLTRLIVNLSPNSNPDIYHGLISVQIRVQQNWNIIEVTPNLTVQYSTQKCIYLKAVLCVVEMSLCVSPARL